MSASCGSEPVAAAVDGSDAPLNAAPVSDNTGLRQQTALLRQLSPLVASSEAKATPARHAGTARHAAGTDNQPPQPCWYLTHAAVINAGLVGAGGTAESF